MDYSIIIVLIIVVLAIGLAMGINKLVECKKIQREDLKVVVSLFGLTLNVIDELDLASEKKIKEIGEIVKDSLNFCVNISDKKEVELKAKEYAYGMCLNLGIELTESRKQIIDILISYGARQIR